jgi:hypothetical protein
MRSDDGVFFGNTFNKGLGESVTYFHDESHVRWWAGRGAFEAYVARISSDITRLDPVLLDTFAGYFGAFVGDKYNPSAVQNYLFDKTKEMRTVAKMFDGFTRTDANRIPQAGFLVHFLVKKNKEGAARALQRFMAGNLRHSDLVNEVLGKVDPAELEKEYTEAFAKFRENFRP